MKKKDYMKMTARDLINRKLRALKIKRLNSPNTDNQNFVDEITGDPKKDCDYAKYHVLCDTYEVEIVGWPNHIKFANLSNLKAGEVEEVLRAFERGDARWEVSRNQPGLKRKWPGLQTADRVRVEGSGASSVGDNTDTGLGTTAQVVASGGEYYYYVICYCNRRRGLTSRALLSISIRSLVACGSVRRC